MGTNFTNGDEIPKKEIDPNFKHDDFIKTDREKETSRLIDNLEAADTPEGKKAVQKQLLKHIEGENYFSEADGIKIILFNGPPRSGKDTVADFAMQHLGKRATKYRFAAPLKDGVHALFGFGGVDTEFFNKSKDQPTEVFKGLFGDKEINTPREAYILMSENFLKPVFGEDFFARVAVRNLKNIRKPVVVISDCGFDVEVSKLVEAFGEKNVALVHLYREGCAFKTEGVKDSRAYVTDIECEKFTIGNDGSVHDLYDSVVKILDTFAPESE